MTPNTTPAPAVQANLWRKKPVVIQATQWFKNGDHPDDYAEDQQGLENGELRTFTGAERKANGWEGGVVRYYRHPDVPSESLCEQCGKPHHIHGWIDTLEQGHRVCPDDWIITGVKGEHYPCKPDIFAATYETAALSVQPVPDAPPALGVAASPPGSPLKPFGHAAIPNAEVEALLWEAIELMGQLRRPGPRTWGHVLAYAPTHDMERMLAFRAHSIENETPSVPPAGAPPRRTIEQLRCDAIFGLGSEWAAMLDDGVLSACYDCATDEDIPLSAEEIAVARAAIHVATCSALLSGDSKKKAIKDAPALYGLLCRANNLLIGSPARGMEARSGETEGLDPKGDSPVPSGTRPETAPETTAQTAPQAEPSDAELRAFEKGWRTASNWMERDDLIADIGSLAYLKDRDAALKQQEQTR